MNDQSSIFQLLDAVIEAAGKEYDSASLNDDPDDPYLTAVAAIEIVFRKIQDGWTA